MRIISWPEGAVAQIKSVGDVLDAVAALLRSGVGDWISQYDYDWLATFYENARAYPVSTAGSHITLGELPADDIARGLGQWSTRGWLNGYHPLTIVFALEAAALCIDLINGTLYSLGLQVEPQYRNFSYYRGFDDRKTKRRITDIVSKLNVEVVVPPGAVVIDAGGDYEDLIEGTRCWGSPTRCHRGRSFDSPPWLKGRRVDAPHIGLLAESGFHQRIALHNGVERACWPPTLTVPVQWITGIVATHDGCGHPLEQPLMIEPCPDWRDPVQVFSYRKPVVEIPLGTPRPRLKLRLPLTLVSSSSPLDS